MIKIIALFTVLACTTSCVSEVMDERHETDKCLYDKLFKECLAAIPKGPTSVVNNDWDEVVDSCLAAAHSMSSRKRKHIPDNCR